MIIRRTFYRPPSPPPARVRPAPEPRRDPGWTARYRAAVLRNLPLALLKEFRDEEAARLVTLKAELLEAQRAAAAEPPTPAGPAPAVLESAPSRVLLGS